MARKRMISPEIWQSNSFSALADFSKLIFIGLFSQADDEGYGKAKPSYIRSVLFPNDEDKRIADIENALSEIAQTMSVIFYEVGGYAYYRLTNWLSWQKVDKPSASRIPKASHEGAKFLYSQNEKLMENSASVRRSLGEEFPTNGMEGNRIEEKRIEESGAPTLEEITAYCKERNNSIDPKRFLDYFMSSGWVDSKGNKVRSWKQKIITWEQTEFIKTTKPSKAQDPNAGIITQDNFKQEDVDKLNAVFDKLNEDLG